MDRGSLFTRWTRPPILTYGQSPSIRRLIVLWLANPNCFCEQPPSRRTRPFRRMATGWPLLRTNQAFGRSMFDPFRTRERRSESLTPAAEFPDGHRSVVNCCTGQTTIRSWRLGMQSKPANLPSNTCAHGLTSNSSTLVSWQIMMLATMGESRRYYRRRIPKIASQKIKSFHE